MCEVNFNLPILRPLPIKTQGKPWTNRVWTWVSSTRQWQVMEDWIYILPADCPCGLALVPMKIPKGFILDGASIPKPFRMILSPTGIMLAAGVIHDFVYKYRCLYDINDNLRVENLDRKAADDLFACVNHDVNQLNVIGKTAYWLLRAFGMLAWNGHRKREGN
jgi:hypothetical protein